MLSVPSITDLAAFTGRDTDAYSSYAEASLSQATLLFSVTTGLTELPSDPGLAQLALNAILEMADRLYLQQNYAETMASPFQSETIGSYTYSKRTQSSTSATTGSGTAGLVWWELAIDKLSVAGSTLVGSGSVGGGFEDLLGRDVNGRRGIRNPADDADVPPYVRIS